MAAWLSAFIVDGVVEEEAEEVRSEEVWWALLIRLSTSRTVELPIPLRGIGGEGGDNVKAAVVRRARDGHGRVRGELRRVARGGLEDLRVLDS